MNKLVMFEVDTGAGVTIVSQEVYQQLFHNLKLRPSLMLLKSYTGNQVKVHTYLEKHKLM